MILDVIALVSYLIVAVLIAVWTRARRLQPWRLRIVPWLVVAVALVAGAERFLPAAPCTAAIALIAAAMVIVTPAVIRAPNVAQLWDLNQKLRLELRALEKRLADLDPKDIAEFIQYVKNLKA